MRCKILLLVLLQHLEIFQHFSVKYWHIEFGISLLPITWHVINWISQYLCMKDLMMALKCKPKNVFACCIFKMPLTLSNPIFLPTAYSPALIYCGRERGWWITCWLKSVLYEEKCRTGSYSGAGEQTPKKKVSDRLLQRSGRTNTKKKVSDVTRHWSRMGKS